MQRYIYAGRFDPIDVDDANEAGCAASLHHEAIEPALRRLRRHTYHLHHALPELPHAALIQARLHTSHGGLKALIAERLQQIIERVGLECPNCMLIVGGHEYGEGHLLHTDRVNYAESIKLRHLHIEEQYVRVFFLDRFNRALSVRGFADRGDLLVAP